MVAPMIAAAGISAVGSILGGKGASKAAKAQVQAGDRAIASNERMFDVARGDLAPWREAGGKAIGSLSDMLQPGYDHTTSPGYQFRFNEGQRAQESSAASKGMLMTGGTLKDLVRFGQGVASDDFNQQFNRTASVAAGGQQANTTLAGLGANMGANNGNIMLQQGNARASGYAGQAAALGGGLNNLAFLAMNGGFGGGGGQPAAFWGGTNTMPRGLY
jgi:hypothetical protein